MSEVYHNQITLSSRWIDFLRPEQNPNKAFDRVRLEKTDCHNDSRRKPLDFVAGIQQSPIGVNPLLHDIRHVGKAGNERTIREISTIAREYACLGPLAIIFHIGLDADFQSAIIDRFFVGLEVCKHGSFLCVVSILSEKIPLSSDSIDFCDFSLDPIKIQTRVLIG